MSSTLIRDGALCASDDWQPLGDDQPWPAQGRVIVSWERWQQDPPPAGTAPEVGLRLPNTVDVGALGDKLSRLSLIALEFPSHADGRAYSQARVLRERLGFAGELRATGDVLRDQLFYMQRCGFNAFALAPGRDAEAALAALGEFSAPYQPAADQVPLIFRRRAAAS